MASPHHKLITGPIKIFHFIYYHMVELFIWYIVLCTSTHVDNHPYDQPAAQAHGPNNLPILNLLYSSPSINKPSQLPIALL